MNLKLIIYATFVILIINIQSQNKNKIDIGLSIGKSYYSSNLSSEWNGNAVPGMIVRIKMTEQFNYFLSFDYEKLDSKKFNYLKVYTLIAGGALRIIEINTFSLIAKTAITNSVFDMRSELNKNDIEAEWGMLVTGEAELIISNKIELGVELSRGVIFTEPEKVYRQKVALNLWYRL